jgi:enamine deaminase RidA (YjgF/YER057c/UK114 family)
LNIRRIEPGRRLSQCVVAGQLAFLAGQVADDPSGDAVAQTRQILAAIDRLLGAAGTDKTRLLSVTIYLADMTDFGAMNTVWDTWVPVDAKPARATVEARLAGPEYRVEIQAVAALP